MKEIDSAVLESQDHRNLLDIVDKLRSGGVSRYIDLPQIVVCGDQSSGKSSVLEAISGIAFPAKDNLCTRFATEVILRRSPSSTVDVSIAPAIDRPEAEKENLRSFMSAGSLETLDLGSVVEEARALMGVGEQKAFSSDVLRVELSGPKQPHLTMVDLPGLFRAGNVEQAAEDADLVRDLVLSYMKRQRTIILAVVSAKSDFALQEVTQLARELDPKGLRTLGLITKPDTLDEGSDSESAYLKLAQNNDVHFRLGWHVLRNRDFSTRTATLEERNRAEMQFFSQGVWASMSPSHLGVTTLRKRLTSVLHDQVLSQLPEVVTDLEEKARECRAQLQKIGPSRATTQEQRRYLIQASHQFYKLMKSATDGIYSDPFFGASKEGYKKRLRAVVQNSLLDLASVMETKGRTKTIVRTLPVGPGEVSRESFLLEVKQLISTDRGCELPGTYNPLVVGQLFRNQSKPWKNLLDQQATSILRNACDAVRSVLEHVLGDDVTEGVFRWILNASLDEIGQSMKRKLSEIMTPHETLHAITYNRSLAGLVRERRLAQQEKELKELIKSTMLNNKVTEATLLPVLLQKAKYDFDRDASADAVDWMEAYYDVSLTRTLDDFSILAVECCLIQKLPGLFSPEVVYLLEDETVQRIAAENEASVTERSRLTDMLAIFEAGLEELRSRTGYQTGMRGKHVIARPQLDGVTETNREVNSVSSKRDLEVHVDRSFSSPPPPAAEYDPWGVTYEEKKKEDSTWDDPEQAVDIPCVQEAEEKPAEEDEWAIPSLPKKQKKKKKGQLGMELQ